MKQNFKMLVKSALKAADSKMTLRQNQVRYKNKIEDNEITFCHGPSGTAKTFVAVYTALDMYAKGSIKKIILTKPIVEAGENLGFLPGDKDEKIELYMQSFRSNMIKLIGGELLGKLEQANVICYLPLAYMRGDTFGNDNLDNDGAIAILDESQNATMKQLMLFTTRKGKNVKLVLSGDTRQSDIAKREVALLEFIKLCRGIKGVGEHKFEREDIVRSKILQEICDRYDNYLDEKWLKNQKKNQYDGILNETKNSFKNGSY